MSYSARYGEAMDFCRKEFKLDVSTSYYEVVVRLYEAYKEIKEKQSLEKEKEQWEPMNQNPSPVMQLKNNSLKSPKKSSKKKLKVTIT